MTHYKELADELRAVKSRSKSALLNREADAIEELVAELRSERYRHDCLQDFEVAQAEELAKTKRYLMEAVARYEALETILEAGIWQSRANKDKEGE